MKKQKCAKNHKGLLTLIGTAAAGTAAVLAYKFIVQPWHSNWGAERGEIEREMPGDELIENPTYLTTRAITVNARPEDIYPWLIQMGQGRGGAYTYDWIENLLGLNMHSADRIVPELQFLKVGDFLPMGSGGDGMIVKFLEENCSLVLEHTGGNWTWAFSLCPVGEGKTRLISRNRIYADWKSFAFRFYLKLIDPGAFVMERKMLLGIKERAEKLRTGKEYGEINLPKTGQDSVLSA